MQKNDKSTINSSYTATKHYKFTTRQLTFDGAIQIFTFIHSSNMQFSGCPFFRCPIFPLPFFPRLHRCCRFFLRRLFSLPNFPVAQFSVALFSVAFFTVAVISVNLIPEIGCRACIPVTDCDEMLSTIIISSIIPIATVQSFSIKYCGRLTSTAAFLVPLAIVTSYNRSYDGQMGGRVMCDVP